MERTAAVLLGLLVALVAITAGIGVGAATLPSSEDLQRASADELGVPPDLLDHPVMAPIVDKISARIQQRVVAEARGSVVAAVATASIVATAGVLGIAMAERRRAPGLSRVARQPH